MKNHFAFALLLVLAFLDYMGVGLVFPLFGGLLFGEASTLLPLETSDAMRGLIMGILISLTPLVQFFASPLLGSLSDQKGRKPVLLCGLAVGFFSYLLAVVGVHISSLILLLVYRALMGIAIATMTVIQACLVDLSTKETKAKNFALYNLALGSGFMFGPFLGGLLSDGSVVSWFNYSTPFAIGAIVTGINMALIAWKLQESHQPKQTEPIHINRGNVQAKKGVYHPALRSAFVGFFFFVFGWDYFQEFSPVLLQKVFGFSTALVGRYFGFIGLLYSLSMVALVRPFISRFPPKKVLYFSMIANGIYLFLFLLVRNPLYLWWITPGSIFLVSLFYPIASTFISDNASEEIQGEMLGVYHSVQALALIISPVCTGSLTGLYPWMPIYIGGTFMLLGGGVFTLGQTVQNKRLKRLRDSL